MQQVNTLCTGAAKGILRHVDNQQSKYKESAEYPPWINTLVLNMIDEFEEHGVFLYMIRR